MVFDDELIKGLIERDTPKKPIPLENIYPRSQYECGNCGAGLLANEKWQDTFCRVCGQKQDWSEFLPKGMKKVEIL